MDEEKVHELITNIRDKRCVSFNDDYHEEYYMEYGKSTMYNGKSWNNVH